MTWLITLFGFQHSALFFYLGFVFSNLHNKYQVWFSPINSLWFEFFVNLIFGEFFPFICVGQYLTKKEHSLCVTRRKKKERREREWALPPPRGIDISPKEMLSPYTHTHILSAATLFQAACSKLYPRKLIYQNHDYKFTKSLKLIM